MTITDTNLVASFNRGHLEGKHVDHPFRYFVAGGETLAQIEQLAQKSEKVFADFAALAAEVGATSFDGERFYFDPTVELEEVPASKKFRNQTHPELISDPETPHLFYADPFLTGRPKFGTLRFFEDPYVSMRERWESRAARVQGDPKDYDDNRRYAGGFGAKSFDGHFFEFEGEDASAAEIDWLPKATRVKSRPYLTAGSLRYLTERADFIDAKIQMKFSVDPTTEAGYAFAKKVAAAQKASADWDHKSGDFLEPVTLFKKWLVKNERVESPGNVVFRGEFFDGLELEKIGDQWIIKVPVLERFPDATEEDDIKTGRAQKVKSWAVPPDSESLKISDYFREAEYAGAVQSAPCPAPTS